MALPVRLHPGEILRTPVPREMVHQIGQIDDRDDRHSKLLTDLLDRR